MAEHCNAYVHTDGDIEDILFRLPPAGRELFKNDEFEFVDANGVTTIYKVKTVLYRVAQKSGGTVSEPNMQRSPPEVFYGVQEK